MESGIRVSEEAVAKFVEMKIKKTCKFLILVIKDDSVVVSKAGNGGVDELFAELPTGDCAFVVYDKGRELTLLMYAPLDATTNSRTIYSTTKQTVEKALEGSRIFKNLVEDHGELKDALA
ncbi:actin depolymerizing factor, putative [Theileria equi strain WA]|uniref:Actin depolymerizing factor, putative n=1 Tax=Theileria equi strain WA TaxID=1537102 RepID=L1LFN2_THEEQ|nr:actin depolymerizing factor, putative [Theileria equi strain WA]EKX74065.1 actin depolymerizing factor, putative [Theileria equi strain WA]|eukprot:XP_004833517.1 actin depolymerizing factor, putative [Theileria equi strain WA]